uniref:ChAPs (Chs5p-Arf1p-binding proteins) protein n=1 Tax=Neospora caninum (strain Liverpool) TaxID=572307 RepID=A0A0F7UF51_NEOCL|nr:TPA: ChAPs (Chs5p-Arf1p-binding proteins) protein [Neospora caninum Liverpool]
MSRCIADCREFVDYHGSLLASRDATLIAGDFDGLGPPDLCCLEKVQKDRSLATFFGSSSHDDAPRTSEAVLFCHYVLGLETSQPAALAAYIYGQVAKQESETSWFGRKWQILGGVYCTFDVFHQVDLRVEVRLPSSAGSKSRFLFASPPFASPALPGALPGPGASGTVFCYAFPSAPLHVPPLLPHAGFAGHSSIGDASAVTSAPANALSPPASILARRQHVRDVRDLPHTAWETALLSSMLRAEVPPRIHPSRCLVVFPVFDKPGRSREFVELASRFFASGDDLGLLPSIGQGTNALCEVLARHVLRTFSSLPKIVETLSSLHALSPLIHLHVARAYSRRKMLPHALTIAIRSLRSFPEEACFLRYQAKVLLTKGDEERKETGEPGGEARGERDRRKSDRDGRDGGKKAGREDVETYPTRLPPPHLWPNRAAPETPFFSPSSASLSRFSVSSSLPRLPARLDPGARALWGHLAVRAAEHAVSLSPTLFPFWMTLARALVFCGDYARALLVLNAAPYVPLSLPLYTKGMSPDVHQYETTEPPQQRSGCFSHLLLPPCDDDFWFLSSPVSDSSGLGKTAPLRLSEGDEENGGGAAEHAHRDSDLGAYVSALTFLWADLDEVDPEKRRHSSSGGEGEPPGQSLQSGGARPRQVSPSPVAFGSRRGNEEERVDLAGSGSSAGKDSGERRKPAGGWGGESQRLGSAGWREGEGEHAAGTLTALAVSEGDERWLEGARDSPDRKREARERPASFASRERRGGCEDLCAFPGREGHPSSSPSFDQRTSASPCEGRHPREKGDSRLPLADAPHPPLSSFAAFSPSPSRGSRRGTKDAVRALTTGEQARPALASQDSALSRPLAPRSASQLRVSAPLMAGFATSSSLERLTVSLNSAKGGRLDYFERKAFKLLSKIQRDISLDLLLALHSRLFSPLRPLPRHLSWALTPSPFPLSTHARQGGEREREEGESDAEGETRFRAGACDGDSGESRKHGERDDLRGDRWASAAGCGAEAESENRASRASECDGEVCAARASFDQAAVDLPVMRNGSSRASASSPSHPSSPAASFGEAASRPDDGGLPQPSRSLDSVGDGERNLPETPSLSPTCSSASRANLSAASLRVSSAASVGEGEGAVRRSEEEAREAVQEATGWPQERRQATEKSERTTEHVREDGEEKVNALRSWLDAQAPLLPESLLRPQSKMLEKVMQALESDAHLYAQLQGHEEELRLLSQLTASEANNRSLVEKAGSFLVTRGSLCCRLGDWRGMCVSYGLALRLGLSCKASCELLHFFVRREAAVAALNVACVTCQHLKRLCGEDFPSLPLWVSGALAKLVDRAGIEVVHVSFSQVPRCARHPAVESFLESRRRAQAPHSAPFP